jgi:hypothetical protein
MIAYRDVATAVTSGATSLSIARPALAQDADLLLAHIVRRATSGAITPPAGWATLDDQTTSGIRSAVYSRKAGDAGAGPYVWSWTVSLAAVGSVVARSDVDTADAVDAVKGTVTPAGHHTTPPVDVSVDEVVLVACYAIVATATWTPPASMTERYDLTSGGTPVSAMGCDERQRWAGNTGARTAIASGSAIGASHMIALRRLGVVKSQRPMAAIVSTHDDFLGFPMLAEFRTAHDISRLLVHTPADKGPGSFSFSIAADDPQANRDTLRPGLVVMIRSTQVGVPPFVGRIDRIEHDLAGGTVHVSGPAYAQVLFERLLPQDCAFSGQAAGVIAMQLLRLANSSNPTGVWPSKLTEPGSPVRGDMDFGSSSLGDALNDLADRTGDEWWLEESVSRQKIELALRWGRKRGRDRSAELALYEGRHFTVAEYTQDSLGKARSAVAVGSGESVADRPAAAASMSPTSVSGKAGISAAASEIHNRNVAVGMTLAREMAVFMPSDADEAVLARAAQKALEVPANAAEELMLTLAPSAPWDLQPGDIFKAVLPNANFGGVTRNVRLLDLAPDEAKGLRETAVRVEYDV